MRRVYGGLIRRWLKAAPGGLSLKTDLFEEAISLHYPLADLGSRTAGMDGSPAVVKSARTNLSQRGAAPLVAVSDLRHIAVRNAAFSSILSGSSLDHFADKADIAVSLAELRRVLASGGRLLVTFDNPHNPVIWLRNRLPFRWLHALRLVPYYVGATYNQAEARAGLEALGFEVCGTTAVAHAPRAPAMWLAALAERLNWPPVSAALAAALDGFEVMERWPTRYLTGYYLVVYARVKPE